VAGLFNHAFKAKVAVTNSLMHYLNGTDNTGNFFEHVGACMRNVN
jgi:hypothetical protein